MADEPATDTDPWVEMTHPKLPGQTATALRAAFTRVWAPLGWELHTPSAAGETPAADTVEAPEAPTSTTDAAPRRKTAATAASKED
ncbi:hypothetical protein ACF09J_07660 [Streptomyces sp. NPDC014889]|uniref:hypothetical protein n=1 Tax=Streptomyces sp. NPDC014889 TaxID=3364928 RepID=UPI0036FE171E